MVGQATAAGRLADLQVTSYLAVLPGWYSLVQLPVGCMCATFTVSQLLSSVEYAVRHSFHSRIPSSEPSLYVCDLPRLLAEQGTKIIIVMTKLGLAHMAQTPNPFRRRGGGTTGPLHCCMTLLSGHATHTIQVTELQAAVYVLPRAVLQ